MKFFKVLSIIKLIIKNVINPLTSYFIDILSAVIFNLLSFFNL